MGIEPTSEAWEASILPLYDARSFSNLLITLQLPFSDSNVFGQRGFVQPGDPCIFLSFKSLTGGNAMLTQYSDLAQQKLVDGLERTLPKRTGIRWWISRNSIRTPPRYPGRS